MDKSIVVVKADNNTDHLHKELIALSVKLADEQLVYMGEAFKNKVSELPTPLNEKYFKDPDIETFCKVVNNEIVSFVSIAHTVGMIGVHYVYTAIGHRRNGHATELFEHVFNQYNKKDHYFYVIAYVKNANATRLYKKLGFVSNYVTMEL